MTQTKARCFLLVLLILAAQAGAQVHNSVSLDHDSYALIEMGVIRGIITPLPSVKPWSRQYVREKLWEMLDDPADKLSSKERDTIAGVLASFDRENGFDLQHGRYRTEGNIYTLETGLGWESDFSVSAPNTSLASTNTAQIYAAGDIVNSISWNLAAMGELLYIGRTQQGALPWVTHDITSFFPYTYGKQWDRGVLSLRSPDAYSGWPDDAALAYDYEFELNGEFFNRLLQLRLGRIRRDWGPEENGISLFMNSRARPSLAFEGMVSPLSWMNILIFSGAVEYFRENEEWPQNPLYNNLLTAARFEFDPWNFFHFDIGASATVIGRPNTGFFSNLELRIPGMLKIWGSLFVDQLDSLSGNFNYKSNNNYAYQAGFKTNIYWLPLAFFSLRYTKVEPFCYTHEFDENNGAWIPSVRAYVNGGESLGYYLPPNSDEFFLRFESMLFPEIKAHIQFQMIRHGVDFGSERVYGSSLRDKLDNADSAKYFLMDGVYRWDNVIKLGGSCRLRASGVPISVYAETGVAITSYTINGTAGPGNEADYETLNNDMYSAGNRFIFSAGFRLFQ